MAKKEKTQMIKGKICKGGYLLGYWKGQRVALIPRYHPDAKPGEYDLEDAEIPSDHPMPRYIDPEKTPLSEIKEICTLNDIPFSWITGIDPRDRKAAKIKDGDPLAKAIERFIALYTAGTTTAQYRRIFDDLIKEGVIDASLLIAKYLKTTNEVEAEALNFSCLEKPDEEHYNYNDKIYNMLRSFHAFLKNPNNPSQRKAKKSNKHYRAKRKNCLTDEEAKVFFPALKAINPIHELIARLLWWFNHEICADLETPNDAPIVHLESVLRMQRSDIGEDSLKHIRAELPEDVGGNSVRIRSYSLPSSKEVCYYVRDKMYAELSALASSTDGFIFRNRAGGPIDARLVRKSFTKACKNANLRNITPNQLR